MRCKCTLSVAFIALLVLGCASANKLSRRSELALMAGDLRGAYEHARHAVEKEPGNARARAAYATAATRLLDDRKARILLIAEVDTVAAAVQTLELSELRSDFLRHGLTPPPDTAFASHETAIRLGAAGIHYRAGERAMAERAPKAAWAEFRSSVRYVAGFRDAPRRTDEAYRLALARVAILPFDDQAGVPGLAKELADRMNDQVGRHLRPEEFTFTELVDPGRVYEHITVAQLGHLTRNDAVRIGRRLGADQVVTGRIHGMRSSTNTTDVRQTIYHRVVQRDTTGKERVRFVEQPLHVVERERTVNVHYEFEVVETEEEASLSAFSKEVEGYARVVFTDFQPVGSTLDYYLYPPDLKKSNPTRAATLDREWKSHFGILSVPLLLARARDDRNRVRYTASHRQDFFGNCHDQPVYLGGLPGENDMASIALDASWKPVLNMLKELDAK
jgi:hypothetical protein